MNLQPLLRAFDPKIYDLIQPYRVTDDTLLPWAYQKANPQGRTKHNDWAIMRGTNRIDTAYRVHLPFKGIEGQFEKRWMLWDTSYPTAPDTQIENREIWTAGGVLTLPHALVDCAVEGSGKATFACYINGEWVKVFTSYRKIVNIPFIGKRLLAAYSGGLKQDVTVGFHSDFTIKSDVLGWWDPPSVSLNKVAA